MYPIRTSDRRATRRSGRRARARHTAPGLRAGRAKQRQTLPSVLIIVTSPQRSRVRPQSLVLLLPRPPLVYTLPTQKKIWLRQNASVRAAVCARRGVARADPAHAQRSRSSRRSPRALSRAFPRSSRSTRSVRASPPPPRLSANPAQMWCVIQRVTRPGPDARAGQDAHAARDGQGPARPARHGEGHHREGGVRPRACGCGCGRC
jgi:hypothetical protein